jgi:hypothetical protein
LSVLLPFALFGTLAVGFSVLAWKNAAGDTPGEWFHHVWRIFTRGPLADRGHYSALGWRYRTLSFLFAGLGILTLLAWALLGG